MKNQEKTKVEMKFVDISQPKMWGFKLGASKPNENPIDDNS